MFYIQHHKDNFTNIDCSLNDENQENILTELITLQKNAGITRFISTHPDEDHLRGLECLDDKLKLVNFYCVKNKATKEEITSSFKRYCELRDSDNKAFHISKGCRRKWMNEDDEQRKSSGISILWPNLGNPDFQIALKTAEEGGSPNNISPIIQYSLEDGPIVLWMGDLETQFMEKIEKDLELPTGCIVFAPHHGRDSGKIPITLLEKMAPKLIVVGEAPSDQLTYYEGYNTITQNSAGDIILECETGKAHIFTSNDYDADFLDDYELPDHSHSYYVGTLNVGKNKKC